MDKDGNPTLKTENIKEEPTSSRSEKEKALKRRSKRLVTQFRGENIDNTWNRSHVDLDFLPQQPADIKEPEPDFPNVPGPSSSKTPDFPNVPGPSSSKTPDEGNVMRGLLHLMRNESRHKEFLDRQERCRAANWLMENYGSLGSPDTIEQAVKIMDTYIGSKPAAVERLQLVAAACFVIAAGLKGKPVSSSTAAGLSTEDMEQEIVFELKRPRLMTVPHDFLPVLCTWCHDTDGSLLASASYIALCVAVSPGEEAELECLPSVLACAAVRTAILLRGFPGNDIARLEKCPIYEKAAQIQDVRRVCSMARKAVRAVGEHGAPYALCMEPPHFVAATVLAAANANRVVRDSERFRSNH